ncbi:hypothetical protein QR680_003476 [Steinernema hermaphroditum]|uniref:Ubiquitin carboxyl-terminal hydrolase n=1 Tax=Steinernema hermaphroditum TaxID=289476 RepID=A0AA39H6Z3_9BILA|nr:hypothetical protein QR680_003476 [Steinernema hermaphroditum]
MTQQENSDVEASCSSPTGNGTTTSAVSYAPNVISTPAGPYKLRSIQQENGKQFTIVLQDENGPCFLLAVVNCLILKGELDIESRAKHAGEVTFSQLINLVGSYLLDQSERNASLLGNLNMESVVKNCFERLENINTGVDIDIKFDRITSFKNFEMPGFVELLGLSLFHGWVIDPQDTELYELIKDKTYEECKFYSLSCENKRLEDFLKTQLTFNGLHDINQAMGNGETAVFFRNNHFSTIVKRKDNVYQLATDISFLHYQNANFVYEALVNMDGDTFYVDADFRTEEARKVALIPSPRNDYTVALSSQRTSNGSKSTVTRPSLVSTHHASNPGTPLTRESAASRDLPNPTMQFPLNTGHELRHRSQNSKCNLL